MSKNTAIQIFLRVRPTKENDPGFKLDEDEHRAQFFIEKNKEMGYINNMEEKWNYAFDQVFGPTTSQEKIFDKIAKDVIDSAMDGYNGTVFVYGQTGSGKTFTMTGDSENYANRGIIPRSISYIFSKKQTRKINITISYFQIYDEDGYDLLNSDGLNKKISDLPKMKVLLSESGQMQIRNLSQNVVENQQDALNLLFLGDMNRIVSKTPMNDESTRSHCIFMIRMQTYHPDSNIKNESIIHLVDLSGSERIKRTGVDGLLEREARSINLSLHYLQRVIVSLNKTAKGQKVHIPYRDSLMTLILKDSIGGNCKTRMIATMSPKPLDMAESICTCKFAMRVALIKNNVEKNESVDPRIIIQKLKQQNAQLKAELALLKGGDVKDELDKYQIEECREKVRKYIESDDPSSKIILNDRLKIEQSFYYFKTIFKQKGGNGSLIIKKSENQPQLANKSNNEQEVKKPNSEDLARYEDEIKKLKLLIHQRDNEIALLLSVINKNGKDGGVSIPVKRQEQNLLVQSVLHQKQVVFPAQLEQQRIAEQSSIKAPSEAPTRQSQTEIQEIQSMLLRPLNLTSQQLLNHTLVFQQFRKAYRKQEVIQQNEQIMKQKMEQGKELGKIVNESRQEINRLKLRLETLRKEMAVQSLVQNSQQMEHPQEAKILGEISRLKEICRVNFDKLRQLKAEITTIQNLLKKNTEILQRDFEKYLAFTEQQRKQAVKDVEPTALASSIQDQQVQKHLKSFFTAREELRKR